MKMLKDVIALKDAGVPEDVVRSTMGDFGDIVDSVFRTTKKATAPGEGHVQRDEEEEEMVEEQMVQEQSEDIEVLGEADGEVGGIDSLAEELENSPLLGECTEAGVEEEESFMDDRKDSTSLVSRGTTLPKFKDPTHGRSVFREKGEKALDGVVTRARRASNL